MNDLIVKVGLILLGAGIGSTSIYLFKKKRKEANVIHEITKKEFEKTCDDARTLSIWLYDNTIYDEDDDKIIKDVDDLISDALLKEFIKDRTKENIYIRNENTGVNYEVFKRKQSYSKYLNER